MKRTTIALPDDVLDRLRAIAAEEHVSLTAVIRATLAERAARWYPETGLQPKLKAAGVFDSGYTDMAERASDGFCFGPPEGERETSPTEEKEKSATERTEAEEKPWPEMTSIGVGHSGRTDIARRTGDEPPEPDPWRS
jgi:hypothetical protein